jgi:hypothetical protein
LRVTQWIWRYGVFRSPLSRETSLTSVRRKLLMEVELPSETQQIDRVLQAFADRYHECNPFVYKDSGSAVFGLLEGYIVNYLQTRLITLHFRSLCCIRTSSTRTTSIKCKKQIMSRILREPLIKMISRRTSWRFYPQCSREMTGYVSDVISVFLCQHHLHTLHSIGG